MWVKCEPDLDQEEKKYEPHNDVAHNSAMTLTLDLGTWVKVTVNPKVLCIKCEPD